MTRESTPTNGFEKAILPLSEVPLEEPEVFAQICCDLWLLVAFLQRYTRLWTSYRKIFTLPYARLDAPKGIV